MIPITSPAEVAQLRADRQRLIVTNDWWRREYAKLQRRLDKTEAELRERIARALCAHTRGDGGAAWDATGDFGRTAWYEEADAVMVVVRPLLAERDAALAEAKRLGQSEGWVSYAAEQERHAETTAARDAHFDARNRMTEQADYWKARAERAEADRAVPAAPVSDYNEVREQIAGLVDRIALNELSDPTGAIMAVVAPIVAERDANDAAYHWAFKCMQRAEADLDAAFEDLRDLAAEREEARSA